MPTSAPSEPQNPPVPSPPEEPGPDPKVSLVIGLYFAVLGGIRFVSVVPFARGYVVDGYPEWLLLYLTVLCAALLLAGTAITAGSFGLARGAAWGRRVLRWGAWASLACTAVHAGFLVKYEQAFGDGGLIWGVVHLLTLTRQPTTGTVAGIAGFKLGLGIGIACWLGLGLACLGVARAARPRAEP